MAHVVPGVGVSRVEVQCNLQAAQCGNGFVGFEQGKAEVALCFRVLRQQFSGAQQRAEGLREVALHLLSHTQNFPALTELRKTLQQIDGGFFAFRVAAIVQKRQQGLGGLGTGFFDHGWCGLQDSIAQAIFPDSSCFCVGESKQV